jgi:hypothetical protein
VVRGHLTGVFDDYEILTSYIKSNARPGDNFFAWDYSELCRDDNHVAFGKIPDAVGRMPQGGAY